VRRQLAGWLPTVAALVWLVAAPAGGEQPPPRPPARLLTGTVAGIVDGDSLKLKTESAVLEVDLAGIDAPEMGQRGGNMAAQVLQGKLFQKDVQVLSLGRTPDQRLQGVIYLDGCINTLLVREGMAWYDPKACKSETLAKAERQARQAGRGLWQNPHPLPPWQWRAARETPRPPETLDVRPRHPLPPADLSGLFQASSPPARPAAAADHPTGYWLTSKSGIRHNSSCRYYRQSKGRPCSAQEGRPCKQCGG